MKNKTILISPVGGQAIIGFIKYFKKKGFIIIGVDHDKDAIGKYFINYFYQIDKIGSKKYFKQVIDIINKHKIDIFISWLDSELSCWNDYFLKNKSNKKIKKIFAFNFADDLYKFQDKLKFYKLLKENNFLSPETHILTNETTKNKL